MRNFIVVAAVIVLAGCGPEVGTKEWCKMMGNKAKLDWTAQEAADYTKFCLFND